MKTHKELVFEAGEIIRLIKPPLKSDKGPRKGSVRLVADALGIRAPMVHSWLRHGVPRPWWLHIEKATKGRIKEAHFAAAPRPSRVQQNAKTPKTAPQPAETP